MVAPASHAAAAGALLDTGVEVIHHGGDILAVLILGQGLLHDLGHLVQQNIGVEVDIAHVPAIPADGSQEERVGALQVDAVLQHAALFNGLHFVVGKVIDDVLDGGLDHDLDGVGVQLAVESHILAVHPGEIGGIHLHVDVGDHTVAEVKVHIGQLAVGPDVIGQLTVGQLDLGQLAVRQLDLGQLAVRQLDLGLLTVGQLHAGPLAQRRGVVSTLGERGDAQQDTNDQRDRQPPVDLLHNTFSLRFSHALHRTAWRLFHPTQNVTCISILYQLQGKSNPFSKFVFLFVFAFRGHGACQHAGGELPLPPRWQFLGFTVSVRAAPGPFRRGRS